VVCSALYIFINNSTVGVSPTVFLSKKLFFFNGKAKVVSNS
jgi:hypothetical protein